MSIRDWREGIVGGKSCGMSSKAMLQMTSRHSADRREAGSEASAAAPACGAHLSDSLQQLLAQNIEYTATTPSAMS